MKVYAFYLPQFHSIPENDEWWGKGFTEWMNVRKAKPLFENHRQPRIPLKNNYYNLLDISTLRWQADLAKNNGIDGFCFYHYWFGEKQLLEKPMEMLLNNPDIKIEYCISWANENWTNQWVSNNPQILMRQEYGDKEEWERHFNYLLKFFQDERYIKIDNKPVVVVYKPEYISIMPELVECWEALAKKNNLEGITWISQLSTKVSEYPDVFNCFDYWLDYEPVCTFIEQSKSKKESIVFLKNVIKKIASRLGVDLEGKKLRGLTIYSYADVWEKIINKAPYSDKQVPGAFVDWDNTPRKGGRGSAIKDATPNEFKIYLKKQLKRCKDIYKKDFIFLFAWNEWAEGGYLEPDDYFEMQYLDAIKTARKELFL